MYANKLIELTKAIADSDRPVTEKTSDLSDMKTNMTKVVAFNNHAATSALTYVTTMGEYDAGKITELDLDKIYDELDAKNQNEGAIVTKAINAVNELSQKNLKLDFFNTKESAYNIAKNFTKDLATFDETLQNELGKAYGKLKSSEVVREIMDTYKATDEAKYSKELASKITSVMSKAPAVKDYTFGKDGLNK